MKKIENILLSTALIFMMGCEKEDGSGYTIPTDVMWTSYVSTYSADIYDESQIYVEPGDYLFLRDLSQSALSHEWTISSNASFFTTVDDTSTTYDAKTITDKDAYIVFQESGICNIKLRNTFASKVVSNNEIPIEATYDETLGVWVFEKEWNVDVYGELKPGFWINRIALDGTTTEVLRVSGDDETSLDDLTDIYISQGDKLQFVYDEESDYKSSSQTWTIPGLPTSDGSGTESWVFNTVGSYSGYYIAATRDEITAIGNTNEIAATTVRKVIPMQLIVEYSNIAPIKSSIIQQWDSKISVPFNKELNVAGATDLASAFSLTIGGESVTITDAEVSADDSSVLLLTIGDHFDNYLLTTGSLSYTPTKESQYIYDGTITGNQISDPAEGFSGADVTLYHIFNSTYFNFDELSSLTSSGNIVNGWWFNRSESQLAADESYIDLAENFEGQYRSLKYVINGESDSDYPVILAFLSSASGDAIEAGTYKMHYKLYVEEYNAIDTSWASEAYLRISLSGGTIDLCKINIAEQTQGCWIDGVADLTLDSDTTLSVMQIRFDRDSANVENFDSCILYIDNIYLSKIN